MQVTTNRVPTHPVEILSRHLGGFLPRVRQIYLLREASVALLKTGDIEIEKECLGFHFAETQDWHPKERLYCFDDPYDVKRDIRWTLLSGVGRRKPNGVDVCE